MSIDRKLQNSQKLRRSGIFMESVMLTRFAPTELPLDLAD